MAYQRRRRSTSSGALSDASYIANRLPWQGAVALGSVSFVVFYWLIPAWITHQIGSIRTEAARPAVEAMLGRRIHWVQWLGIAFALICAFYAVRNYLTTQRLGRFGEQNVSLLGRLLARWLD